MKKDIYQYRCFRLKFYANTNAIWLVQSTAPFYFIPFVVTVCIAILTGFFLLLIVSWRVSVFFSVLFVSFDVGS